MSKATKVFFDVDGVLIDGWHAKPERRKPWAANLQQDLGIDHTQFEHGFFQTPDGKHSSIMHGCVCGDYDLKDALRKFLPTIGYSGNVEVVTRYWFERDSNINRPVFAAVERLSRTSQIDLYLATGQEHYRAAYLWNELGFKTYFKDIFYGASLGELKTNLAFFQKINGALGITADERPLFFDDQEEVVEIARSVGWDACVLDTAADVINHPRLKIFL